MLNDAQKLGLIACCSGMLITSLYALVPFVVLKIGVTENRQAIGFWTGFVVAAFYLSRTVAAPVWGWIADRTCKSFVIRVSLSLTGCLVALSGLAISLEALSILRFLTGACSTVHALCSAMAYDLFGKKGTALVESGWSLSKLIGPGFGSTLLLIHPPSFALNYPILVPCFSLAALQFLMLLIVPSKGGQERHELLLPVQADENKPATDPVVSVFVGRRSRARALLLGAGVVFVNMSMEEVLVLYGIGELGIDASMIGSAYFIAGCIDLILQNTILLRLIEKYDTLMLRRMAISLDAIALMVLPYLVQSPEAKWLRLVGLGVFAGIRTALRYIFFVSNSVALNEASRGSLASINSWRVAISSAMQTVSPPIGASAYAFLATSGYPKATFTIAAILLAFFLPIA